MTLRNRFLLIGLGILIFLIVTPLLILFARGFKWDWQTGQITKTGAIVVATEPAKATVSLNGKDADTTPTTLRFLLPGDYDIRIEKDGYQPWSKRLTVRSQLVTWANAGRDSITLFRNQPQLLSAFPIGDRSKLPPDKPSDDSFGWSIVELKLVRANPQTKAAETIYDNLPPHAQSQIIAADGRIFLLLDQTLYVLNDTLEEIYRSVTSASWQPTSRQLLFANAHEVLLFNPDNNQTDLIFRSTTPIRSPQLNLETGFLFLEHEEKIKAVELDARDHRNIYSLAAAGDDFMIDDKGEKLYVIGETEIKEYRIR